MKSTEGTTQGDPLAMAKYALSISPLIYRQRHLEPNTKQVRFADDEKAAGKLENIQQWWEYLYKLDLHVGKC